MSKALTKEQLQLKKFRRLSDKSLEQLLLHRFLNNYGYDRGEITAKAIINDILQLIIDYFFILPTSKHYQLLDLPLQDGRIAS